MSNSEPLLQQWFPHAINPFIANAPMFGSADYRLATAVTKAGGLGFIGGGFGFAPGSAMLIKLNDQLEKARSELEGHTSTEGLPIGVGFITCLPEGLIENAIPLLRSHQVAAIWLAFPRDDEYHSSVIDVIRSDREWNVRIFVQVGTVQAAREAIKQGVDVVVVQGSDAGGHQWAQGASLISLLPEVRDALEESGAASRTAIVAAGGIVDGRGCTAAYGLGADGIVMGTRFLVTEECPTPLHFKQTILNSSDGGVSTIKSTRHDVYQSSDIWPRQYDGRAVIGISYNESELGDSDEDIIKRYKAAMENGEDYRRTVWAGASIGLIKELVTVSELIKGVQNEHRATIARLVDRAAVKPTR